MTSIEITQSDSAPKFVVPTLAATADVFERRRRIYTKRLADQNPGSPTPGQSGMPLVACLVIEGLWAAPGDYEQEFEDGVFVGLLVPAVEPVVADDDCMISARKQVYQTARMGASLSAGGQFEVYASSWAAAGEDAQNVHEQFNLEDYATWDDLYNSVTDRCFDMTAMIEEI